MAGAVAVILGTIRTYPVGITEREKEVECLEDLLYQQIDQP